MGKINGYIVFGVLLLWISAGIFGCGVQGRETAEESPMENSKRENAEDAAETVLSLPGGEIRSIWMEKDVLYAFAASDDKEKPYGIYEVRDGSLSEDTPYKEVMEQWLGTEMKKSPAFSYEYEARLGRNEVVYLLGRDKEGCVRRCYWLEEAFYTDIPFYEKYEGRAISNIEISRTGKIYLENHYGGFIFPYDDFYGSIGFNVNAETKRAILGERHMYQLAEGWIYVWDIPSGASMEMIRCDVLENGGTPVFIDKSDGIYLMGGNGLAYLPDGGNVWEILVDKDEPEFSGGTFDLRQIWVCEAELYLRGMDMETGRWQIRRRSLPGKAVKK